MMKKVTELDLDFAKKYLRVDFDEDDELIEMMIAASQGFIQNYLNKKFTEFEEIPDEFTIPALALISHWYSKREISDKGADELLYVFSGILDMHRMWQGGGEII